METALRPGRRVAGTAAGGAAGFAYGARRARAQPRPQPPTLGARHTCMTPRSRLLSLCTGKPVRRYGCYFLAGCSAFLFFTRAFQQSYYRLIGQRPNPDECARAGIPFTE